MACVGSCAMESHEPRQVRKEATVSDPLHVPQGSRTPPAYRGPTLQSFQAAAAVFFSNPAQGIRMAV